ncbi:MAG: SDR family NAD(P)-dependent oxidoreductase [Caulobacteraceae bacterium]|nr:SDR family NAD(P)-dependent oxidoreductase [Caulobacteraceae bacterium]
MTFDDKVVLIVGASSGMGRILAQRLAAMGAKVAVTARRQELLDSLKAEIAAKGGQCLALAADATDEAAAAQVVADTVAAFGRIDMVMLNAGGAPALDLRTIGVSEVKAYMRSNYDVVVNYLFPVLHQMRRQGGGVVAHTNSLAGLFGVPLQGPYSAAKSAARMLIDTCRIEFAGENIRFVTVYPGFVSTAVTRNDGMPTPMEISEDAAVDHILFALRKEKANYLFPPNISRMVRLLLILPRRLREWMLLRDLKATRAASASAQS